MKKLANALPGQETCQALVSHKNKMKRLEIIEAKLKKHIEVLKRAQKELERIVKEKENEKSNNNSK